MGFSSSQYSKELKSDIEEIKKQKWHQKWWGAFLIGFLSGIFANWIWSLISSMKI